MGNRHRAVLDRIGDAAEVAARLKLPVERVKGWWKADRGIPGRYWPAVARLSGYSVEYLAKTRPLPPPRSPKAAACKRPARRKVAAE